nr:succinate dehydrogenase assembly factor 2 [Oceanobacter mangrovi]
MLELDVLLVPFVEQAYSGLDEADKQRYQQLLEEEDTDLFAWFLERVVPDNADLQRIVNLVLEHARSTKRT